MKVQKAKSIAEIYNEAKDYDLVLTVEAPLSDSLNNRMEKPHLGFFATTPKRFVRKNTKEDLLEKRDLFNEIINRTDLTWKQAFFTLDNIISCFKETGDMEKILEYEKFDNKQTRTVLGIVKNSNNIFKAMSEYKIKGKKVAVVGFYQFNELDKKILPSDFDIINIFKNEKKDLPIFHLFNSENEITRAVKQNITKENANDVSVVMKPNGKYQHLVESALDSKNIPYMTQKKLSESENLRNFLGMCRILCSEKSLKLKDIQPFLKNFGKFVSQKHREKYIENLDVKDISEFKDFITKNKKSDFSSFLKVYKKRTKKSLDELDTILKEIEFSNKKINEKNLDLLEYYLDSFEIATGGKDSGVLFVSPHSVGFVDRSLIFHLGMDVSWTKTLPKPPWINRKKREEKNTKNFKLLLQNQNSFYLVQDKSLNETITPCFYFDEILDWNFNSFSDFKHEKHTLKKEKETSGFEKEKKNVEIKKEKTISQSYLNILTECPRNYFFSRLVETIDKDFLEKGNLFHDFAEFYVNHPEFVNSLDENEIINFMVGKIKPFVDDLEIKLLKTEFRVGVKNIKKYVEENPIEKETISGYEKKQNQNVFAKKYKRDINTEITEVWFEDVELGAKGKIDLVQNKKHLVDYKTKRNHSPYWIIKNSNIEMLEDKPNFQAIMYLSHHRKHVDGKITFTFFNFLGNTGDVLKGEDNLEDNITTINYYPKNFNEQIKEKETFDFLKTSKKRKKLLNVLGYKKYQKIFSELTIPKKCQYNKKEIDKEKLHCNLMKKCKPFLVIGRGKDITGKQLLDASKSILRKLVDFRTNNYFKEDMDRFDLFLKKKLKELNHYKKTRFPVGDVDLSKIENKDLILDE